MDDPGAEELAAFNAVLQAAGPGRHALAAELALRLARLGHVTEVRVRTAPGEESLKATRTALRGLTTAFLAAGGSTNHAQAAQEAPGATTAGDGELPAEEPAASPVSLGGIGAGIVAEVRAALGSGPLSLRSLRVRVGRGWGPVRTALEGLVDTGEVIRDGQRGRHVRFRLAAPQAARPCRPRGGEDRRWV